MKMKNKPLNSYTKYQAIFSEKKIVYNFDVHRFQNCRGL